ncbi:aldehyde dehydrogenase family protein [Sphingomonas sp. R86521]|uniref:aldehyde dehydrogenase family protein n=1 Tax=Sphingomonas sp. R86521 TaxID=3093860 RepID=UPI0036D2E9A7
MTRITSINPATGEPIADHALLDAAGIDAALERAWAGWQDWRTVPVAARSERLQRLGTVLRRRADSFASMIVQEMGKPISQARGEVEKCAVLCDWYAANGAAMLADAVREGGFPMEALFHTNKHKPDRPQYDASRMVTLHPMTSAPLYQGRYPD